MEVCVPSNDAKYYKSKPTVLDIYKDALGG